MRIKDISASLRPRERLINEGVSVLSNSELLAVILQKGIYGENVIDLSNKIISRFGISKLSFCSFKELTSVKGVGKAKACQILALFEFNKRSSFARKSKHKIKNAKDVYEYFVDELSDKKKEYFYALLLDSKNCVIGKKLVSVGTLNSSLVHPREVFKEAVKESANSIILVHNHPSGDCDASHEDEVITACMKKAGDVMNIKVLDHVIVTDSSWKSVG